MKYEPQSRSTSRSFWPLAGVNRQVFEVCASKKPYKTSFCIEGSFISTSHSHKKYVLSFTAGALMLHESVRVAEVYSELKNWEEVRRTSGENNVLSARTARSSARLVSEVVSRIRLLEPELLALLVSGTMQEKRQVLWLAICRRYTFIADFAVEVLREHLLNLRLKVTWDDFNNFFQRKAEWHPELEALKQVTVQKARGSLFKILREAELIDEEFSLAASMLSPAVAKVILESAPEQIRFFPVTDVQIREWQQHGE